MGGNIKKLRKQDRAVVRTAPDVERRYRLNQIAPLEEEVEDLKEDMKVDQKLSASSTNAIANKPVTEALAEKVNKEDGKGLSTNDFTNAYKTKVDSIEKNAQVNVIEKIIVNGTEQAITNKTVNIDVSGGSGGGTNNDNIWNIVYPIGSYYETSDENFDPNVSWGGTWKLDSVGRVTVSQDTSQDEFKTVGQTGGNKEHSHKLSNGYAQLKANKGTATGGYVSKATESYSTNVKFYTSKIASATTDNMTEGVQLAGSTDASNNLQPYIVVKRWHRTA